MGSQVTLQYDVEVIGISSAKLQSLIALPPVPKDLLQMLGARVLSDNVAAGPPVSRTVVLGFDPTVVADATLTLDSAGVIERVVVGTKGHPYIVPPLVTVAGLQKPLPAVNNHPILKSFLCVSAISGLVGGGAYVAPTVAFLGGLPPAPRGYTAAAVRYVSIKDPGLGYDPATTVTIDGGGPQSSAPAVAATGTVVLDANGRITGVLMTNMGSGYVKSPQIRFHSPTQPRKIAKAFAVMGLGRPAQATAVVVGNVITAINITDSGDGYVSVPDIVIADSAGSGASAIAEMGVGRVDALARGKAIPVTATVVFTPVFQKYVPAAGAGDDPNQRKPFFDLMKAALAQACHSPIISHAPVVA
jgi:hypothetical protein